MTYDLKGTEVTDVRKKLFIWLHNILNSLKGHKENDLHVSNQCLSPSQKKEEKLLTAVKHTQLHIYQINNANKKNVWLCLTPGNNILSGIYS